MTERSGQPSSSSTDDGLDDPTTTRASRRAAAPPAPVGPVSSMPSALPRPAGALPPRARPPRVAPPPPLVPQGLGPTGVGPQGVEASLAEPSEPNAGTALEADAIGESTSELARRALASGALASGSALAKGALAKGALASGALVSGALASAGAAATPARASAEEDPPKELLAGRFELRRELDRGGMGSIHEALDRTTGELVAIKMLHAQLAGEHEHLARFRREAMVSMRIAHPNVVRVLHVETDGPEPPFLVMELLRGVSLARYLRERGPLPVAEAVDVTLGLLSALSAVHATGVVHRDIKPSNVILAEEDDVVVPKLIDFGIACLREGGIYQRLTASGVLVGTPSYVAPETIRGEDADARTDLYAVGVLLFTCLVGRVPFRAPTLELLLDAIQHEPAPEIGTLRDDLPRDLDVVLGIALSKVREQRFTRAEAMAEALRTVQHRAIPAKVTREMRSFPGRPDANTDPESVVGALRISTPTRRLGQGASLRPMGAATGPLDGVLGQATDTSPSASSPSWPSSPRVDAPPAVFAAPPAASVRPPSAPSAAPSASAVPTGPSGHSTATLVVVAVVAAAAGMIVGGVLATLAVVLAR